jgi:hypothetical protein
MVVLRSKRPARRDTFPKVIDVKIDFIIVDSTVDEIRLTVAIVDAPGMTKEDDTAGAAAEDIRGITVVTPLMFVASTPIWLSDLAVRTIMTVLERKEIGSRVVVFRRCRSLCYYRLTVTTSFDKPLKWKSSDVVLCLFSGRREQTS